MKPGLATTCLSVVLYICLPLNGPHSTTSVRLLQLNFAAGMAPACGRGGGTSSTASRACTSWACCRTTCCGRRGTGRRRRLRACPSPPLLSAAAPPGPSSPAPSAGARATAGAPMPPSVAHVSHIIQCAQFAVHSVRMQGQRFGTVAMLGCGGLLGQVSCLHKHRFLAQRRAGRCEFLTCYMPRTFVQSGTCSITMHSCSGSGVES